MINPIQKIISKQQLNFLCQKKQMEIAFNALIAQSVERVAVNHKVSGSNPDWGDKF